MQSDQHLSLFSLDSVIPLVSVLVNLRPLQVSVATQASLSLTWFETPRQVYMLPGSFTSSDQKFCLPWCLYQ